VRRAEVNFTFEVAMNEETFNISIRKFLKMVGVSSQREIEHAVGRAMADGAIVGNEAFPAHVTLEIAGLKLSVKFEGEIRLE
jgi:hypothetical protein